MAKSALSSLVPLFILFVIIVIGAAVGFVVYSIANEVADTTSKKMEKHNVSFSKEGLKVGVKGKSAEEAEDSAQKQDFPTLLRKVQTDFGYSVMMKVWNASSWPAYKSRLGWGQASGASPAGTGGTPAQEKRNPYARTASS